MSKESRATALTLAAQFIGGTSIEIIEHATKFNEFILAEEGHPSTFAVAEAPKPKAKKPAEPAKVEPKPEPKSEPEPKVEGPSDKDVGDKLEALLKANKRKEAVDLLKKFGATSKSTLTADKYAAFIAGADEILLTA